MPYVLDDLSAASLHEGISGAKPNVTLSHSETEGRVVSNDYIDGDCGFRKGLGG